MRVAAHHDNRQDNKDAGATKAPVAVALTHEGRDVPRVVASGHGAIAERILELAFAHGVKVREDADLAQILALVDLDSEIPLEAFAAVSEILAYVYKANGTAAPESFSTFAPGQESPLP